MNLVNFKTDWQALIDNKLDDFIHTGMMVIDEVFDKPALIALQQESGFMDYKEATLTGGERHANVRGDNIRWIDEACPVGMQYLSAIDELGKYFNQMLFAGIRRCEAHYAHYPSGFGYQWHSDNPNGRDERVISAVYYLNDDWTTADGGQISIYDHNDELRQLLPHLNRLVIFDSNLRHQVEITHRTRYSIATWLRKDDGVL